MKLTVHFSLKQFVSSFFTASTILSSIMEAVGRTQPTMVHLLGPLVTKRLETLKFNFLRDSPFQSAATSKEYKDVATEFLYLADAQQSV